MKRLPVIGFEDLYEVSEAGEVYALDRKVKGKDGVIYSFKGKHKSKCLNKHTGYFMVHLYKENVGHHRTIHSIVAEVFIPNPENKPEVNHIDGDKLNNCIDNLEWVTSSENKYHAINTGLRTYTNKLTEEELLDCLNRVIQGESYLSLTQDVPYKVPFLSTKLRKIARKYNLEHLLNDSLEEQRKQRAINNGNKNR